AAPAGHADPAPPAGEVARIPGAGTDAGPGGQVHSPTGPDPGRRHRGPAHTCAAAAHARYPIASPADRHPAAPAWRADACSFDGRAGGAVAGAVALAAAPGLAAASLLPSAPARPAAIAGHGRPAAARPALVAHGPVVVLGRLRPARLRPQPFQPRPAAPGQPRDRDPAGGRRAGRAIRGA